MVLANSMGTVQGHDRDEVLDIITVGTGARYVNVDMASPAGIQRAKGLNLGSSSLAEVIATPFLFETADIFKGVPETGKCFTLLRHPVDRAISLYHHYQLDESGNPNTSQYRGMTIDQFADEVQENNWMVRFLANKRSGSLTWRDLEAAKEGQLQCGMMSQVHYFFFHRVSSHSFLLHQSIRTEMPRRTGRQNRGLTNALRALLWVGQEDS